MGTNPFIRHIRARPRLFLCGLIGLAVYPLLPQSLDLLPVTGALLSWNVGIFLYLLLCVLMISRSTHEQIYYQARLQDDSPTGNPPAWNFPEMTPLTTVTFCTLPM